MAWLCGLGSPNNCKADRYFNWIGGVGVRVEENHISRGVQKELQYSVRISCLRMTWLYSPPRPLEDYHLRVKARLAVIISLTMSL